PRSNGRGFRITLRCYGLLEPPVPVVVELEPCPVVAGLGAWAVGGGTRDGAFVVEAGGMPLSAVLVVVPVLLNTNISTSASTIRPATQPHIALEASSSPNRC